MSVAFKDYYKILGASIGSSPDEIKKKYRNLAKEYHPDKNRDDKASEEKFKEISDAYSVLSDPVKRRAYDRTGDPRRTADPIEQMFSGLGISFFRRRPPKRDPRMAIHITMKEAYEGCLKKIQIDQAIFCSSCSGKGIVAPKTDQGPCTVCQGAGTMEGIIPCSSCGGSGAAGVSPCRICSSNGFIRKRADISISIPPQTRCGENLRLSGMGNVDSNGRQGDLYLSVRYPVQEDGYRVLSDGTLRAAIAIPWESALRDEEIDFNILGASKVKIKLDGKKSSGYIQTFKGLGMGKRNLLVEVIFLIHENMNKKDRKIIAKVLDKYAISESHR